MPTSPSAGIEPHDAEPAAWPLLPVETEIYILPDGRVVIADLPAELAPVVAALGLPTPCAIAAADESAPHEQ